MPHGGPRVGAGRPKGSRSPNRKPVGKPLTERVMLQLSDMCKLHTEDAVKCLAAIMNNDMGNENARIAAAREILDRGHGKSAQVHTGDDPDTQIIVVTHVPRHSDTTDAIDAEHSPVMIEAAE